MFVIHLNIIDVIGLSAVAVILLLTGIGQLIDKWNRHRFRQIHARRNKLRKVQ